MNREDEIKAERLAIATHQLRLDELLSDVWPKEDDECWFAIKPKYVQTYFNEWSTELSLGLLHRTQADAQMHHELMKVVQELRECDGFRPFVVGKDNYTFHYDVEDDRIAMGECSLIDVGFEHLYYRTREQRDAALEKVGRLRLHKIMQWAAGRGR